MPFSVPGLKLLSRPDATGFDPCQIFRIMAGTMIR